MRGCTASFFAFSGNSHLFLQKTPTPRRYLTEDGQLVVGFQLGWAADEDDMWRPFPGYRDSLPYPPSEFRFSLPPPRVTVVTLLASFPPPFPLSRYAPSVSWGCSAHL
jgi:hypothetical protein